MSRRAARAGGKGGRPRLLRVVKTLNQLDRIASDDAAWEDLDDLTPSAV